MNLSIIIVNWNTRALLAQCLESVYANPPLGEFEVIVVDNGSTDDSVPMLRERYPQVRLIANAENIGFVRANNQAIATCHGNCVMLLNSDTIVKRDALANMQRFMAEHSETGILGAVVENPDGTPQQCFGRFPTVFSEFVYAWGLDRWRPIAPWFAPPSVSSNEFFSTDWVLGAALVVRRDVLDQVGDLDEDYLMYSEEVDLCYRVRKRGWVNHILGSARIVHWGGQSSRQIPASTKAELFRSKTKYFEKHHGQMVAMLMYVVFATSILGRRWVYCLRGQKQKAEIWHAVWKNFVDQSRSSLELNRSARTI